MGKRLIILGADFSNSAIPQEFEVLKCIVANSSTQGIRMTDTSFLTPSVKVDATLMYHGSSTPVIYMGVYHRTNPADNLQINPQTYNNNTYIIGRYGNHVIERSVEGIFVADDVLNIVMTPVECIRTNVTAGTTKTVTYEATDYPHSHDKFGLLGCFEESGNLVTGSGIGFMGCKIYSNYADSKSLVHDLIPIKRLSDNKVGIYDITTGEYLFTDDGTNPSYIKLDGTFVDNSGS